MQVFSLDIVDSTNEEAKRLIRRGDVTGTAYVLAQEQTAGKGSRGRSWASPKDAGIYLSVIELPRSSGIAPTTTFTLAAGVACAEALRETAEVDVKLKPVNDLYVDGRKLGGILTETVIRDGKIDALITGVGINVHRADRTIQSDAVDPICLAEIIPPHQFAQLDLKGIAAVIVTAIHRWNGTVFAGRTDEVCRAWELHKVPGTTIPES